MAARKSAIYIEFGVFEDLAAQLEKLGADMKETFSEVMEKEGRKVAQDTKAAVAAANLPAGGKYSQGETAKSIIENPRVEWSGFLGELPLGFNKTMRGAGGFLITGTPRMRPDYALEKIYGQKRYESQMKKEIAKGLQEQIDKRLGKFT